MRFTKNSISFFFRFGAGVSVVQPLTCLLFPYLAYLIAESFGLSGILAIVVCGMGMKQYIVGNISEQSLVTVNYFMKTLSSRFKKFFLNFNCWLWVGHAPYGSVRVLRFIFLFLFLVLNLEQLSYLKVCVPHFILLKLFFGSRVGPALYVNVWNPLRSFLELKS